MMATNANLGLTALLASLLCLGAAEAAVFDAGEALKADMAGTPANPYTDANGGVWTFGKTTAVSGGTVTTLNDPGYSWGADLLGFSDTVGDTLPTVNVNTGAVAVAALGGLTSGYLVEPGEIVLHPDDGTEASRFAIIRFIAPQTGVYDVSATFRDVNNVGGNSPGADVHVVVNGVDVSNGVVSSDGAPPAGSVPSFTADVRALPLAAGGMIDFVVGPNGMGNYAHGADGTGVRAAVTLQPPHVSDIINLDINGYNPLTDNDPVPGMDKNYSGAGRIGETNDFWNRMSITHATFESRTAPSLKLADGLTGTTVSFSLSAGSGNTMNADFAGYAANPLLNDYVYVTGSTTYRFTISGLVPAAAYDLYFYCQGGNVYYPGRFAINGSSYDSVYKWFPSSSENGDHAVCLGITADGNGSITGDFSAPTGVGVFNGLQIAGAFPLSQAETVNIDLNGYDPNDGSWDPPPGSGDAHVGAARAGWSGDFWNSVAVKHRSLGGTAPNLKPANGITNDTTVSFSLSRVGGDDGGVLYADRSGSLNALFNDFVYVVGGANRFTISGLAPGAAYDLYFYCRLDAASYPGRFVINGAAYDSIDMTDTSGAGGDTAVCAGVAADGGGSITGEFRAAATVGVFNGLQIVGTFPRRRADLVNIDINGYVPAEEAPPGAGDTYSGAARVGALGDYWNSLAVAHLAVTNSITLPRLKLADGVTKSAVSFSVTRADGIALYADRMPVEASLNPLLADYLYFDGAGNAFTISGLAPGTAYDLFFYCNAGVNYLPARFAINGADYFSYDKWFPGGAGGDYAACAGILANAGGEITGDIYQAAGGPACVCGVQILGTFPLGPQGSVIFVH